MRIPGNEAECLGFAATKDAFLAVPEKKADLLNAAQVLEAQLREELEREKESHMVDIQNVTSYMDADVEKLQKENKHLAATLWVAESNFAKADAVVKVFGQKVVSKITEGFFLA